MSLAPPTVLPDLLLGALRQALKVEADKLVAEAMKELERRTPEIVAGIVVDAMQMAQFEVLQDRIVFTIKKLP